MLFPHCAQRSGQALFQADSHPKLMRNRRDSKVKAMAECLNWLKAWCLASVRLSFDPIIWNSCSVNDEIVLQHFVGQNDLEARLLFGQNWEWFFDNILCRSFQVLSMMLESPDHKTSSQAASQHIERFPFVKLCSSFSKLHRLEGLQRQQDLSIEYVATTWWSYPKVILSTMRRILVERLW